MKKILCKVYKGGTVHMTHAFAGKAVIKPYYQYQGNRELTTNQITLMRLQGFKIVEID